MKKSLVILSMAVLFPAVQVSYAGNEATITKKSTSTAKHSSRSEFDFSFSAQSGVVKQIGDNKYQILISDLGKQGMIASSETSDQEIDATYKKFNDFWHKGGATSFSELPPMGLIRLKGANLPPVKMTDFYFNSDVNTVLINFSGVVNVATGKVPPLTKKNIIFGKKYSQGVSVFIDSSAGW